MSKRATSTLNLQYSPLSKLIIGAAKGQLTGCLKIKFSEEKRTILWFKSGEFFGVSGVTSLVDRLGFYKYVSERVIPNIKSEKLIAPLGEKLKKVYEVTEEQLKHLFKDQIAEVVNIIGETKGQVTVAKINYKNFPFSELTGLEISSYELVKQAIEKNFTVRYQASLPERDRTIETGLTEFNRVQLDQDYLKILGACNSNKTLSQIAKALGVPLINLQKKVLILETLEIVKLGITKDTAYKLYRKFYGNNSSNSRSVNFGKNVKWYLPFLTISGFNLLTIVFVWIGSIQNFELGFLDSFLRIRGTKPNPDIVIVTIDDQDISQYPTYPIADRYLAQALKNIAAAEPTAIGLDIYRDLPQEPGHQELLQVYQDTPQIIGVEKIDLNDPVNPPPILAETGRVGFSDLIIDADNTIRRATWLAEDNVGNLKFNLGAISAMQHLTTKTLVNDQLTDILDKEEPVPIIQNASNPYEYTIGNTTFLNLHQQSGGYWTGDIVGLQFLLDFRYNTEDFDSISFHSIYKNQFDPNKIRNKLVLVGITADSKKDFVYSPLSASYRQGRPMPGVVAHANIASTLIDAAKGIKPLQVNSRMWEIGYIIFWSLIGIGLGLLVLEINLKLKMKRFYAIGLQFITLGIFSYLTGLCSLLILNRWLPIVSPFLSSLFSTSIVNLQYQNEIETLVYSDKQSKVANRHYFDNQFQIYLNDIKLRDSNCGLVLCQILDWEEIKHDLDKKSLQIFMREIAKDISTKIKLDNANNFVARFTEDTLAFLVLDTNTIKLNDLVDEIHKKMSVNKSLTKLGYNSLNLAFGVSISDKKKNNSLALIADADEKLMNED